MGVGGGDLVGGDGEDLEVDKRGERVKVGEIGEVVVG